MPRKRRPRPTPAEMDGNLAVSFANTAVGKRRSPADYAELAAWGHEFGDLSAAEAQSLASLADADPEAAGAVLRQARELVPLLRRLFGAAVRGTNAERADVERFRQLLPGAFAGRTVHAGLSDGYSWGWREGELGRVLWGVLHAAAHALVHDSARLRVCPGEDCGLFFVALTAKSRRKWCCDQDCGDRHRTRAYYRKSRR